VKGGDTMANIKRTKLVLRFNSLTIMWKPLVMRWQLCMTTACPTWSASMKYP